jgi:GxxExxY protein
MFFAPTKAGISVRREVPVPVYFRGQDVGQFKADLMGRAVLIELKAFQNLDRSHEAQVMNYLRATELEVGLLLNFGSPKPQFKRIVFENSNKKIRVYPRVSAVGNS